jgi:hypothetical protein
MIGDRSSQRFVHYPLKIKSWIARPPTAEDARPGQCPCCHEASRPLGENLVLQGHGLRSRQIRGPEEPDSAPLVQIVWLRRYRCQHCRAVVTVGPLGLMPGWLFSAPAIAWALALYGLAKASASEVRRRVNPWRVVGATAAGSWASLKRWIRSVRRRKLFPVVRPCPPTWSPKKIAERAASTLAALAPPSDREQPLEQGAWHGAEQLGRAIVM